MQGYRVNKIKQTAQKTRPRQCGFFVENYLVFMFFAYIYLISLHRILKLKMANKTRTREKILVSLTLRTGLDNRGVIRIILRNQMQVEEVILTMLEGEQIMYLYNEDGTPFNFPQCDNPVTDLDFCMSIFPNKARLLSTFSSYIQEEFRAVIEKYNQLPF